MGENLSSTLIKAQQIRDYVNQSSHGVSLKEITKALDLNKTTVYRLLTTMVQLRQLVKVERLYYPGILTTTSQFKPIGWLASKIVQPFVNKHHLSAFLGMPYDGHLVITQVFADQEHVLDFFELGAQQELNTSALGKCILAFMGPPLRNKLVKTKHWAAQTRFSIIDQPDLEYSLAVIRQQGFALDDEEVDLKKRCLAVPVWDGDGHLEATLGIVGSTQSIQRQKIKQLAQDLQNVSQQLTNQLFN